MSTPTPSPKVVVIGAGSLFFGRQAIWQMVHSPHLNNGTLALVDTDPQRLHQMTTLGEMVARENGVNLCCEADSAVYADAVIRELLEVERDALPGCWFE